MSDYSAFFLMKPEDVKRYAVEVLHFFQPEEETDCVEIGDGNINYVFQVRSRKDGRSVIVKQADKLLRSSGRPLDLYRNKIEAETLMLEARLAPKFIPEVYHYDETMAALSMEDISAYKNLRKELAAGKDPIQAIVENTVESLNRRYSTMQIVGDHLAELIPQGGTILTQCFGETIIGTVIRAARCQNKDFKVFCAETRPYLQGARLTSGCFAQMGFDTTVITDNMVAYAMEREGIDLFTSAADTIARDGHIANKIGTFQIAILAKYFGIPYYVTGIPDQDKHSKDDIVIEMRDPQQVLSYRGIPNTVPEVKAIYPSFDVVPPHLISGVVTDKGVYVPYLLDHYFDSDVKKFY